MSATHRLLSRIRRRVKGAGRDAGWRLGIGPAVFRNARGGRILAYHGICKKHPLQFNTLFITRASFEDQLRLYKKYFHLVSLDEFYRGDFKKDRFTLCLTFDDGFANNFHYVLPLLEKYEVPAAFFITAIRGAGHDILWNDLLALAHVYGPPEFTFYNEQFIQSRTDKYISAASGMLLTDLLRQTDFTAKEELFRKLDPDGRLKRKADPDYWLQMTEQQILELSKSKWVTIGSHGYYHNDLARLQPSMVSDEMIRSKSFLEDLTGREVRALSFPYGSYSPETIRAAEQSGYKQLLATEFLNAGDRQHPLLRERMIINPFVSAINQMHANISGHYD